MRSRICWRVWRTVARAMGRPIVPGKLTPCDTRCYGPAMRARTLLPALTALALLVPAAAQARPASADKDGRPNILVVMTDDQAKADVAHMPNVKRLLAARGTSFADAVDSFPLCCPSRATFITGQYAHNHGVGGNFWPFGWYGMKHRGNILPAWLQRAG